MADQLTGLLSPFLRSRRIAAARPFLRAGSVLDIGCGTGQLARHVDPARYLGVDRDEESIAIARQKFPRHDFLTLSDFSNLTVLNGQVAAHTIAKKREFDQIVGLAIVEHVGDPKEWLEWLQTLLKPGGRVILTTPHPSMRGFHEFGASIGLFSREGAREHRELIDRNRMSEVGAEAGFRIRESRRFLFGCNQLFILEAA